MKPTPWQLRVSAITALTAAAWLGGQALAQNNNPAQDARTIPGAATTDLHPPGQAAGTHDLRMSQLIGKEVYNTQGREIGEINDFVIDVNSQRVQYAVVGVGGFLGLGEKLFAYPVRSLQYNDDILLADLTEARLRRAPSFDRNRWPDWNDPAQRDPVDRFHAAGIGAGASAGAAGNPLPNGTRMMRASEIIGRDIRDARGDDAGEIEDLVVNLDTAQLRYAVVDFDKAWSPDDKLLALPLNALSLPAASSGDAVLQVPREQIDMTQGFDDDEWPDLNDPQYRERIERQLPAYRNGPGSQRQRGQGQDGGAAAPRAN